MKKLVMIAGIAFVTGCASMPIVGPFSYIAAESNRPRPGLAAGEQPSPVWGATKATLGYAVDAFMWGTAAKWVGDQMNKSDSDNKATQITINGDNNTINNNQNDSGNQDTTSSRDDNHTEGE